MLLTAIAFQAAYHDTFFEPTVARATPTPSGAAPAFIRTFDFSVPSEGEVGKPPANYDIETASSQVGTPPSNFDFVTGTLSDWATTGSPAIGGTTPDFYVQLESGARVNPPRARWRRTRR